MRLRVVLVRPRYAGNVGAAVRVAANFAVREVAIVRPACPLDDDPEFVRMAMGGERLVALSSHRTLAEAVEGCQAVIATTSARTRDRRAIHSPAAARERLIDAGVEVAALVFGPERSGLPHEELRTCHLTLAVPTAPAFPVLNLAQAVGIVVAALADCPAVPAPPADAMDHPAAQAELAAAITHLEATLLASGYLDRQNPSRVTDQFRRWLGRTVPTRREVALLHALAAHLTYLLERGSQPRADS
jgi:tRNA (cytidine32/uridine32-2'-O)-methyltransferase